MIIADTMQIPSITQNNIMFTIPVSPPCNKYKIHYCNDKSNDRKNQGNHSISLPFPVGTEPVPCDINPVLPTGMCLLGRNPV